MRRVGVMKMLEFKLLPREEQIAIIYQEAVYIGKQKGKRFTRLLFQLESFYVEIFYSSYRKSIYEMHYSGSTIILEPYLEQIAVEDLVT